MQLYAKQESDGRTDPPTLTLVGWFSEAFGLSVGSPVVVLRDQTMIEPDDPDEIITVLLCRGCDQLSFPGDLVPATDNGRGSQLRCPRCGTIANAESFFDYVDIRTVDYE
jgi:hypothetical protein